MIFQMNNPRNRSSARLLSLIPALLVAAGCGPSHPHAPARQDSLPTASVRVQKAESQPRPVYEEVVGTVRAKQRATLEAKLSGRITEMPITLGQTVRSGQLLARLDAAEIKARLEQAQAALDQAKRDWTRISALTQGQAATRAEYDAADARLRVAQAAVAEAEVMLSYTQVQAPFDGVITRKWMEPGDLAAPGKPILDLQGLSAFQVEADIPEAIASQVTLSSQLSVRIDALTNDISGTVSELSPAADPSSRTFRVKLDLPNAFHSSSASTPDAPFPTPQFLSGQFARLLVKVRDSAPTTVPVSALVRRGQMEMVFALDKRQARMKLVKTGKTFGGAIEILSGLEPGETVVAEGAANLLDGQTVEAKP
jgi:RND family efflux transporter MFP subunit